MTTQPYLKAGRDFAFPDYKPRYPRQTSFKINHYRLELKVDIEDRRVDGYAEIRLTSNGSMAELDAVDFQILEVTGVKERDYDGKLLTLFFDGAGEKVVGIRYRAWPRTGVHFVEKEKGYGFPFVWSHGEPEYHRNWMPIYDYPNMKFTTELLVTVPQPLEVVSNGELLNRRNNADGTSTFHWQMDKPHPAYLISFVAGVFDKDEEMVDGVRLEYYVPKGFGKLVKNSFNKTADIIRFFSNYLNYPYPFKSYRQVCVPEFVVGGMENTTATTLTDLTLHDDHAHMDFSSDPLVAHEAAHQWFGDLVTCRDWSHIWLNESFATYLENLYLRHDKGNDEFLYELYNDLQSYLDEYKRRYSRPVVYRVYKYPEELFDRHAYPKGGLVLHTIKNIVGEESFRKALNLFLTRHQYSNADTEDLRKALEESSGMMLEKVFEQLVYSAGHPVVKVSYRWEPETNLFKISFKQVQAEDSPETYGLSLDVVIHSGGEKVERKISLEERETTLFLSMKNRPEHVCVDPELKVLRVLDIERPLEEALSMVEKCGSVVCRIEMIDSLAKHGGRRVVEVLERVISGDPFWGVSYRAAKALGEIKTEEAKAALLRVLQKVKHPKIRRGIVEALGSFEKDTEVMRMLAKVVEDTVESYYVRQAAAISLGRLKLDEAVPVLVKALDYPSHAHVIPSGAVQGLAETGLEKVYEHVSKRVEKSYPTPVRVSATVALAKFPEKHETYTLLERLSEDSNERVRHAVVAAARELMDPRLLPMLDKMAEKDLNERVRRGAREVSKKIRDHLEKGVEYKSLREELEKIREENRRLAERLYRVEGKV